MKNKTLLNVILIVTLITINSYCQNEPMENDQTSKTFSIALNPLGVLTGAVGTNFEYLVNHNKSVLIEGVYFTGKTIAEFLGINEGLEGSIHFRHRLQPGLNSSFVGVFLRYADLETLSHPKEDQDIITKSTLTHVGLNYGRKWIFKNGFDFRYRIGFGFGQTDVDVTGVNVEQDVIDITRSVTKIFAGLDAELGFGYCF
jgi:hypothetical protein